MRNDTKYFQHKIVILTILGVIFSMIQQPGLGGPEIPEEKRDEARTASETRVRV